MSKRILIVVASLVLILVLILVCVVVSVRGFRPSVPMSTQAVQIYLKLSDTESGTPAERERLFALDEQLATRFQSKQPFEYDGHEIGEGFFTLYFYGPSADAILSTIRPSLSEFGIPPGSHAIRRYGDVGFREERLPL